MAKSIDGRALPKGLPPCPEGFSARVWLNRQMWLLWEKKIPEDQVRRLTTARQVNLWCWLLSLGHPWQWIADNETVLIDKNFKRKPGQA